MTMPSSNRISITMRTDESAVKDFFASYFHEDWRLDAESPDEVIAAYFQEHGSVDDLEAFRRGLTHFLHTVQDDAVLSDRLHRAFGCYFDPQASGTSTREWLERVVL